MHIHLGTDVGPRSIACGEVLSRVAFGFRSALARGALLEPEWTYLAATAPRGEGGQLQSGSRLEPPLSEGWAAAR